MRHLLLLAVVTLTACGAHPEAAEEAELGETAQELCLDHPLNPDAVLQYVEAPGGGNELTAISSLPTNSYSHGNCIPGSYVVEIENVGQATREIQVLAHNYPPATSKRTCESYRARAGVWVEELTCPSPGLCFFDWMYHGTANWKNVWVELGGGKCLPLAPVQDQVKLQPNPTRQRIKLDVTTYSTSSCGGQCTTRAKAGIRVAADP